METGSIHIRRARASDLAALSRFALALAEVHVGFDARRFSVPAGGERAFAAFFRAELDRSDGVVLIAERETTPVGYAFVRMEAESVEDLRGRAAFLHDIYVEPRARGGVGRELLDAAKEAARGLGSKSLMLGVSPHNPAARRLFESAGLRPTMIEMRVELDP